MIDCLKVINVGLTELFERSVRKQVFSALAWIDVGAASQLSACSRTMFRIIGKVVISK